MRDPASSPLGIRDRIAVALVAVTAIAAGAEVVRASPDTADASLRALLAVQAWVLSALWCAPLAGLLAGADAVVRRLRAAGHGGAPARGIAAGGGSWSGSWLIWAGPALAAALTTGTALLAWSERAFVRRDLAAALLSGLLLGAFAAVGLAWALAHLALRRLTRRIPARVAGALALAGAGGAVALHIARSPALLDDPFVPAALQLASAAAAGVAALALAGPLARRMLRGSAQPQLDRSVPAPGHRREWLPVAAYAVVTAGLAGAMMYGARIAPLSYPVASAAIQTRGLVAARIAPLLHRVGDGDGDGFGRWFGGLDCDDGDAAVHPLAAEIPGNGVDEDCFEGDLSPDAVRADREARRAARPSPRQRARSAILITVDALRADAVGFGGARLPTTPALDALARTSAVFTRAYTQAPMTRRAFPSLLTGRYPSNVRWLDLQTSYPYTVSHSDNLFLAEILRAAGFDTAMVVAFSYPRHGRFNQGFAIEKIRPASRYKREINADVIARDAIEQLERWARGAAAGEREAGEPPREAGEPPRFFLWLHFYEAHHPYVRHGSTGDLGPGAFGRYLSEIRFIDEQIARVLARLRELGLHGETAVVFTSDHGEEFGEHGGQFHGDLYPEDLHVPLLVHLPAGPAGARGRRVTAGAALVDVAPTILDLLGVAIPEGLDGASLMPWIEGSGAAADDRLVFAELIPDRKVPRRVVTAIRGGWQLIADFGVGTRELYHLDRDPTAQRNLFVREPAQAWALEAALRRHMALRVGPLRIEQARSGR